MGGCSRWLAKPRISAKCRYTFWGVLDDDWTAWLAGRGRGRVRPAVGAPQPARPLPALCAQLLSRPWLPSPAVAARARILWRRSDYPVPHSAADGAPGAGEL